MKFTLAAFVAAKLLALSTVDASFLRDVVQTGEKRTARENAIEDALLEKAIPLTEYRANLKAQGFETPEDSRRLDDGENDDDYYMDGNYMYSFSGYSLKYAKCQPVQRFSEDAITAGEYTPMITDDIVILRLCPYRFCSSSRTFGCHYNYAEFAVGLTDYVRVMLRYKMDKKEQLCDWCESCYARRHLDDADEAQDDGEDADDEGDADDGEDEGDAEDGDDAANGDDNESNYADDNVDDVYYSDDACYEYKTYCYDDDGYDVCEDDGDDDTYLATEDYFDYLDCTRVEDSNGYGYYVRPRCDGYKETIKMAVYHDAFCADYAGNQVSLKDFGLGFKEGMFQEFYSDAACLDCSQSNSPPYFNANDNMCNKIHVSGIKCTTNLQYDLFDDSQSSDSTQCSFIESVQFGTYDEVGQLYVDSTQYGVSRRVTDPQKYGLGISLGICGLLAVYACYMHHSITNLLIKSLSHTDLLPPSRHRRSSRGSKGRSRRRRVTEDDEDEEWDMKGTPA